MLRVLALLALAAVTPEAPAQLIIAAGAGGGVPPEGGGGEGEGPFLWVNTYESNYYNREHMFLNEMRNAHEWAPLVDVDGTLTPSGDAGLIADLTAVLDANGYPTEIPSSMDGVFTSFLFAANGIAEAPSIAGRYKLVYEGSGTLTFTSGGGGTLDVTSGAGWYEFDWEPTLMPWVRVEITATSGSGNHLKGMAAFKTEYEDEYDLGQVHHPLFAEDWGDVKVFRHMGHTFANRQDTPVATWADRPEPGDMMYSVPSDPTAYIHQGGSSIEDLVAISNELGVDLWVNIPHTADPEDYTREMAELIRDTLDPDIHAYFEFSNELWNLAFPQAVYMADQRIIEWGPGLHDWVQYGAYKAGQHMDVVADVFTGEMDRVTRVVGLQTAGYGLGENALASPWVVDELMLPPTYTHFDALAITSYFYADDGTIGTVEQDLVDRLESEMYTEEQNREWLQAILDDNIDGEIAGFWAVYAGIAEEYGLDLLLYEGGTHVLRLSTTTNNAIIEEFYDGYSWSQQMADNYANSLSEWEALEVTGVEKGGYMQFITTTYLAPQYGFWGALRHMDDSNPRYDILMDYNDGTFP